MGAGFSANTEASVGAQVFVGGHLSARADSRNSIEVGTEIAGSVRSTPLRLGLGEDITGTIRHEPSSKGLGWMPGFYVGARGLFLAGNRTEFREGVSFAFLPTLAVDNRTWKQFAVELQVGYSAILNEPGVAKPVDDGEFALRFFYEVSSTDDRLFR